MAETTKKVNDERARLIDLYAVAAVNLYGVLPMDVFCKIFNSHGNAPLDEQEAKNVFNKFSGRDYMILDGYLVYAVGENVGALVETILKQTEGKPRYVPNCKEDFLKHLDLYYTEIPEILEKIEEIFRKVLKHKNEVSLLMGEFLQMLKLDYPLQEFASLVDGYEMRFDTPEDGNQYFALVIEAKNNSRTWTNKGFTPRQMAALKQKIQAMQEESGK